MTSTATSTELVQSLFAAFGRGDIPFILAHLSPDCRWVATGEGLPYAGVYTGPAGAGEFFTRLAASEDITRFEPREYFVNGDDVIVLGFEECRVKSNGKTASTNWAMLFRVRGGLVTYWENFIDTSAYLRAHNG